jgi:hypothetical protein
MAKKKESEELQVEFERPLYPSETFKGLLQKKTKSRIVIVAMLNVWQEGKLKEVRYINLKPVK